MKSKMIKLLLGMASTLMVLTVVEMGLRVSDYDPNTSPWYRFEPDLGWTLDPVHRRVGGLNSGGFRSPQVSRIKPQGTRRLLNLGDSFSAAMNVDYGQTYPGLLADWLSRNGESWEVINLAVGDWGTNQQLIALQTLGLDLKPDVVVLQVFPFNDLCNNSVELAHTCSMQDLFRPYLNATVTDLQPVFLNPVRAALRSRFRIFGLVEGTCGSGLALDPGDKTRRTRLGSALFPAACAASRTLRDRSSCVPSPRRTTVSTTAESLGRYRRGFESDEKASRPAGDSAHRPGCSLQMDADETLAPVFARET